MYQAQLVDGGGGSARRWLVSAPGQPGVVWEGFSTGPVVLSEAELDAVARSLLGLGLSEVAGAAAAEIESFVAADGPPPPALLLHSATSSTRGFEGDLTDVRAGRRPWDVAGYLETRVVALARPGDLAVGRTESWREAVTVRGTAHVDVTDRDHYYLSQALLRAAQEHAAGRPGPAGTIVDWLRDRPDAVVRIYALDPELQVLLVWLRRAAGLDRLRIDANDPVVSGRWNQKNHLHPTVEAALRIDPELTRADASPYELLAAEQRGGEGHRRLGMTIPVLPGYTIPRAGRDQAAFLSTARAAAHLLRVRHGITRGCLKPSEAGDGARIVAGLDLDDSGRFEREVRSAHQHGDDYLLEAHIEFGTFEAAGRSFILTPSGHIRGGHVAPGLTLQLMNGQAWEGNAYVDERTCASVGLPRETYDELRAVLAHIRDVFHTPSAAADGCHAGLVTGGIDFAVGVIGGRYGEAVVDATLDFNLSSHGAEYLRTFLDEVIPAGHAYAASRVYRPASHAGLARTEEVVQAAARPGERVTTVASVPGSWAMVASTGPDPRAAIMNVLALVDELVVRGLATR